VTRYLADRQISAGLAAMDGKDSKDSKDGTVRDDKLTGAVPGAVLRSGRDTRTVPTR
jgi:hypothetical protein